MLIVSAYLIGRQPDIKLYIIKKKIQIFVTNMPFFHLVKRENVYFIRGLATHEICIFPLLDEINVIFIPKI